MPLVVNERLIPILCTSNIMAAAPEQNSHDEFAVLMLPDGKHHQLRVLKPTQGNEIILDIRDLHARANCLTFDPGYNSTASCCSAITYVDAEQGECRYRGYAVHHLVERADFLEVCYLLLYGNLPPPAVHSAFEKQIKREMLVHERMTNLFSGVMTSAHPMAIMDTVVSALSSFHCNPMDLPQDAFEERELACVRLIAKMGTLVAMTYKTTIGEPYVFPNLKLSYAENLLHMMFSTPLGPYQVDPLHAKIINAFLIMHADHEQNASTSTVRTAGSSGANPYACISAGITSLWGRAHGGANEAVLKMLKEIGSVENIPKFVESVKEKKARLMGFGHRIYRNHDPRSKIMRKLCYKLFEKNGGKPDLVFNLAIELEHVALKDEYFIKRRLYPNVDFYSGIVLRAIGIPEQMFTVMFALGRTVGWLSHWKEMVQEQQMKIVRPRQLYVGPGERSVEDHYGEVTPSRNISQATVDEVALPTNVSEQNDLLKEVMDKGELVPSGRPHAKSRCNSYDLASRSFSAPPRTLQSCPEVHLWGRDYLIIEEGLGSGAPFHVLQAMLTKRQPTNVNFVTDYDFDVWGEVWTEEHIHMSHE